MSWLQKIFIVILIFGMTIPVFVNAQEKGGVPPPSLADSTFSLDKLDSIFSYSDSLSIFNMIDSLLKSQSEVGSSLVVRAGFNSNIISAGRSIGVSQYGATAGGSYYHKSGLYADVSMYWSEAYQPSLYLTTLSVGYLKTFFRNYTAMASYDRLIYNSTDINVENPLTNMLGLSNFVDIKPVTLRLDFSFYFGQKTAHRITPGVSISLRKYKFLGLDRISFTPTYQMLFGSATITSIQLAQRNSVLLGRKLPIVQQTDSNEFGLMNHALSLPLRISKKNWSFTFSYSYNWPVALPKEESTLPENSYTSLTLSKMINFKSR
ncbi:MAG: hypothetical protein ACOVMQ_08385 [Cyclobacteriaceae bacterium]